MLLKPNTLQIIVNHLAHQVQTNTIPGTKKITFAAAVPRAFPVVEMLITALHDRFKSSEVELEHIYITHGEKIDYWVAINRPSEMMGGDLAHSGTWLYLFESPKEVLVLPWDYNRAPSTSKEEQARAFAVGMDGATTLLQSLGVKIDPSNQETPYRVSKAWREMTRGYYQNPSSMATMFDEKCDEMVILRNIEFSSSCEHHMLPFSGFAHVAYIPNDRVIGVSKLARFVDVYAKRLQIQERIGNQVTDALNQILKPKGAACIIEAKHYCMVCRGVQKQSTSMITSSLTGVFKKPEVRAELLSLVSMG